MSPIMTDRAATDRARMLGLILGGAVSQAICAAVELELPAMLEDGPRGVDELAERCRADRWYIERLLRGLAGFGVFVAAADGAFELTALGRTLLGRDSDGASLAGLARFAGSRWSADARVALTDGVRSGVSAFSRAHGADLYDCMQHHPDLAELYEGWTGYATGIDSLAAPVLAAYDFSRAHHVVDVGGRYGALLGRILESTPGLTGTLFDLPGTETQARVQLRSLGVASRCRVVTGSFFDAVPKSGDVYLLSNVLPDWNDDQAARILRSCRAAMDTGAVLLTIEPVFGAGALASSGVGMLDLWMMINTGGLRDQQELCALIANAGFHVGSVIRTASGAATLIEAAAG
jgi:C-methyltransferase